MSAILLDDVRTFIRRFVVLDDVRPTRSRCGSRTRTSSMRSAARRTWRSPRREKRSGKTRLLEVLELLVREPLPTANISDAALFRVIDERQPTLLIDEVDAIFGKKSPRDELRGIINAGYRRGATTHRMGGANNTTLADVLRLLPEGVRGDRRLPARHGRRPRDPDPAQAAHAGRARSNGSGFGRSSPKGTICATASPTGSSLSTTTSSRADPTLPDELDDRAQDVWEPLLAVADLAHELGGTRTRTRRSRSRPARSARTTPSPRTLIRDISRRLRRERRRAAQDRRPPRRSLRDRGVARGATGTASRCRRTDCRGCSSRTGSRRCRSGSTGKTVRGLQGRAVRRRLRPTRR